MVKTLCFQCNGFGFDSWLGKEDPTCCEAKKKKKKSLKTFHPKRVEMTFSEILILNLT